MMTASLLSVLRRPTWLLRDKSSCFPLWAHALVAQPPPPPQPLSLRRWLSSISRMLDLGGAPSSATDKKNVARTVNASKNCRLRAIVFDLATLTRSIDDATASPPSTVEATESAAAAELEVNVRTRVQPDVSKVEAIANVLKVTLGGSSNSNDAGSAARRGKWDRDDLSLLTGKRSSPPPPAAPSPTTAASAGGDIRAKYASKLSGKGAGTITSVELARQQAEESMKRGDAGGHWAARKMVGAPTASTSSTAAGATKWMARTGTGRLLQYLTQRSIRIALIPSQPDPTSKSEGDDMTALQRQLQDVVFDALVPPDPEMPATAASVLSRAFERLGRDDEMSAVTAASAVLLVSSREDYLREAKERGWMTCHVRPKNGPRGNVSTNYTVETVPDVRQAVDEINGISYSAVLNAR